MDARYRLTPMREARARDERVKREELAGAVNDAQSLAASVEQAARRVADLQTKIADLIDRRDRALGAVRPTLRSSPLRPSTPAATSVQGAAGVTIADLVRADRYLARLRRELAAAQDAHTRADARHRGQLDTVDDARDRLGRARAEREVIERHFAAWRAERKKLAERRED